MKKIIWPVILLLCLWACGEGPVTENKVAGSFTVSTVGIQVHNNQEIELAVSTSEAVREVAFCVDGSPIGSVTSEPYVLLWTPVNIGPGNHTLTASIIPYEGDDALLSMNIEIVLGLGDNYRGGIIFYLDDTGEHGLIASASDVSLNNSVNFMWSTAGFIGATDSIEGRHNTLLMAAESTGPDYAGYPFKNGLELNGYSDWYIPAKAEMSLLMERRGFIGEFPSHPDAAYYWTSTECCRVKACAMNIFYLSDSVTHKLDNRYRIRPIRKF